MEQLCEDFLSTRDVVNNVFDHLDIVMNVLDTFVELSLADTCFPHLSPEPALFTSVRMVKCPQKM